ncbi:MAG: DNA polymerase III subunit delta [Pseudomonadota bacterium]
MKIAARSAPGFCRAPDTSLIGALLFGPDDGLIAERRRDLVAALLGGDDTDMRLTRLAAADARKDAALVADELRAQGFFPGRRVVVIEDGTDGLGKPLAAALDGVTDADAFLVVAAGTLTARSALRKLFETDGRLAAVQMFADAPDPRDVEERLRLAGVAAPVSRDAVEVLVGLGADMDHGSFAQLLTKIAVYVTGQTEQVSAEQVLAMAPQGLDTEVDRLVQAVADGRPGEIGGLMRRLGASGAAPTTLLIAMARHFRQLMLAASAPGGAEAGIALIKPPLWGPRRSAFSGQLRKWRQDRLEQANRLLFETDGKVRSAAPVPGEALVERCFLRLAMMAGR